MDPGFRHRLLQIELRLMGGCELLALPAAFFPSSTMAGFHGWLGLGVMPTDLLTVYLARTTSLLYAFHGAALVFLSRDIERYQPLIRFWGVLTGLLGILLLTIDLLESVPAWWTAFEGPVLLLMGSQLVTLTNTTARPGPAESASTK